MKNLKLVKDKFFLLTKADRRVLVFLSAALCLATAVLVYCTFHRTQHDEKASMTSDEITLKLCCAKTLLIAPLPAIGSHMQPSPINLLLTNDSVANVGV